MAIKSSDRLIVNKLKAAETQRRQLEAVRQKNTTTQLNQTKLSPSNRIDTAIEAEAFERESLTGPMDSMVELEMLKDNHGPLDTNREQQARDRGPGVINTPHRAKAVGKKLEDNIDESIGAHQTISGFKNN